MPLKIPSSELLKQLYGTDELPITVNKPWGTELIYAHNARYCGKILRINKGGILSTQYHRDKIESNYLLQGRLWLTKDNVRSPLEAGAVWSNQPYQEHSLEARVFSIVLEVSTPEIDDVVRLSDVYGRAGTDKP